MTQDEMMASGAAQAADVGIGPTTDHTSARGCGQATEVTSGKRRRSWTAEQKRQIVAESLVPGASAAAVARKHGISSGQFYAWRQQLVLSGAFGAATAPRPSAVRADEPTAALSREAAVLSAPPEVEIRRKRPVFAVGGVCSARVM
jgi:transposase